MPRHQFEVIREVDHDLDQILITILGFFALLALLLVVLERLESSLDARPSPSARGSSSLWRKLTRTRR